MSVGVFVVFHFRFSAKIKSGFRICYSMRYGVFPVGPRKTCTSTACVPPLILLGLSVLVMIEIYFGFAVFLLLFARFCGFLYTPMPPSQKRELSLAVPVRYPRH